MNSYFTNDILEGISRWGDVVRVVITRTQGSTPRDVGASMVVGGEGFLGTVGGGKLEFLALQHAALMLNEETRCARRQTESFVLGTQLRQCCGGVAWLLFEKYSSDNVVELTAFQKTLSLDDWVMRTTDDTTDLLSNASDGTKLEQWPQIAKAVQKKINGNDAVSGFLLSDKEADTWFVEPACYRKAPLYIYGAGHVGRALVRVLEGTPFDITWVDTDENRFPKDIRKGINPVVSKLKTEYGAVGQENNAFHVVMTYSHEADFDICRSILMKGQGCYLGLIASQTKRAKFINRLKKEGVTEEALKMLRCPIGLISFKQKDPAVIAISIAAQLLCEYEQGSSDLMANKIGEMDEQ